MPLRVAELETLFTANTDPIDKADKKIKDTGKRIESKPIVAKVTADEKGALAGMDRVEQAAKKIVTAKTAATVDANIDRAEKSFMRVFERLDYLKSVRTELDVEADIKRAEANLSKVQRSLDGLRSARATMEIDANTQPAEDALADAADAAGEAGSDAGAEFGDNIVAALLTIPIAGAVIGIGVAAGKALADGVNEGLQQERSFDRLQALTGISPEDALRFGRAAGEAYANVFGESIEQNMDTARLALQFDLIDPEASTRSAKKVVESLTGIADVLGEDVRPVAAAVTQMLRTGVAKTADEAFDILAAGARNGVNVSEDLLDTFTEYPALFARLGLSGDEALGLLNQGLEGGARNSDLAADALKEFQIRATDASETSAAGFEALGLNAEDMTAKIARGGRDARDGLAEVLDKLRETEDPIARNAAAVALFGTQAEDLGEALFKMDLSSAVEQLDGVTGSAQKMFDTIAGNDATKIEQAGRNIEVAAEGIKGALAQAFSEPLGEFAEFVSQNRGPVMQFFLDLANGAIDFGISLVESSASGAEALGEFVAGPLADAAEGLRNFIKISNPFADTSQLDGLIDGMREFDDTTADAADSMRENLIKNGLEPARDRLNEFGKGAVAMGFLNDASLRLAGALDKVGTDADGAKLSLEGIDLANLRASDSGLILEDQVRSAVAALGDEIDAADRAGESQEELAGRYATGTEALAAQLEQMGLTEEQAQTLIDTVLRTPKSATTEFSSNAQAEQGKVQGLADRIVTLPDGSVVVRADTSPADEAMASFMRDWNGQTVAVNVANARNYAQGAVVEFMAAGGLTPMSPVAQMVPPSTYRVVGDRTDVSEAYIPLDGSQRSLAILFEAMRRMGVMPMAAGGVTGSAAGGVDMALMVQILSEIAANTARGVRLPVDPVQSALGSGYKSGTTNGAV